MSELSPSEQRQITQELHLRCRALGIQAASHLVSTLAVERATLKIYYDEFSRMENEGEDIASITKQIDLVTFLKEIEEDYDHAMGRYAYALTALYDLQSS